MTQTQNDTLLAEMMDWCFENDIEYITELMEYAYKQRTDWLPILSCPKKRVQINEYLEAHSKR